MGEYGGFCLGRNIITTTFRMKLENRRVRKYLNTWETDFRWLGFEEDNNKMHSKVFRQFSSLADITSSLYTGTGSFRKTTIMTQALARSKSHSSCTEAHRATERKPKSKKKADETIQKYPLFEQRKFGICKVCKV